MVRSCNTSFITLIPKKKGAVELKDFRPISLISNVYKLVAKILAERMKRVIGKLGSGQQSAFIKNRQITDASLIANEVLDWRIKNMETVLLCKLDIEKDFDQSKLVIPYQHAEDDEIWSPVGLFSPTKRPQARRSPFSIPPFTGHGRPYTNAGQSQGDELDTGVSNDTLIFCGAERLQVSHLNLTLLIFEGISGLQINMLKSTIYLINEVSNLEELAEFLCCKIGSLPTTYLGLPLGAKYKSIGVWSDVVEKVEKRLSAWQMQYLSMGGRLTLIISVLDSIPSYCMSLYPMPSSVLKQLERLRRRFLWEGNNTTHKFPLVKWAKVIRPKYDGGMGLRNLKLHNKNMLMKWLWRYGQLELAYWEDVITTKHGAQNQWCTKENNAPHEIAGCYNSLNAHNREGNTWNPLFRRNLQDWEMNDLLLILSTLEECKIKEHQPERLIWVNSIRGKYTIKAIYNLICSQNEMLEDWPWKHVWRTRQPLKVSCFT
ncbi:uncharacterized protein LOC142167360 [Nicotiana tabacum]|uniref:Uncharacterized protein LOC142167360 n=1 Tax=Nicotiana tabacum TaxID=4097 RepID=A0AC58SFB8_TOBAC